MVSYKEFKDYTNLDLTSASYEEITREYLRFLEERSDVISDDIILDFVKNLQADYGLSEEESEQVVDQIEKIFKERQQEQVENEEGSIQEFGHLKIEDMIGNMDEEERKTFIKETTLSLSGLDLGDYYVEVLTPLFYQYCQKNSSDYPNASLVQFLKAYLSEVIERSKTDKNLPSLAQVQLAIMQEAVNKEPFFYENENLKNKLNEAYKEISFLQQAPSIIDLVNERIKDIVTDVEIEKNKAKEELDHLQNQLNTSKKNNSQLEKKTHLLQEELGQKKDELELKEKEIGRLSQENASLKKSIKEGPELSEKKNIEKVSDTENLKKQLQKEREKNQSLSESYMELEEKLRQLESEKSNLHKQLIDQQMQIAAEKSNLNKFQKDLETFFSNIQHYFQNSNSELDSTIKAFSLEDEFASIEQLQQSLKKLEELIELDFAKKEMIHKEPSTQNASKEEQANLYNELQEAVQPVEELRNKIEALETDKIASKERENALQAHLEQLKNQLESQTQEAQEQLQKLQEIVQTKDEALRTLQKTAADQKGILEEQLKALQAETAQEKGANKDLNSRIDALSQKITDMQTQHAGEEEKLRAELKSAATAHEQVLREAVQMKEDELRTLQKTAADQKGILEEQLKALQAETAQEKGANKDLNSRIDALSQKITDMQTQHAGEEEKLRAELKSAATAHEQVLREAVQMKEDELRTLQKTAADQKGILEEQLKALQAETAQEKGANKDLNSRIDALSQKITDMQTQHAGEEEKLRAELKSAATAHEQVLREAVQMKEDELRTLQKTAADQKGILEEQLKALQAETAQEKGANKDLNSRIDALSQKITDMQTQHAGEEEKLRAELKSAATAHEQVLREAVQMKEDELRTLQKTAADQKGILEEQLKALQAETAQEKGANKDLNSRIDALSQKIADMQTQHAGEEEKLRAELKSAATAHEQVLREAVQMKEDELRTLQKTAADQKGILEEQLKALQAETAQEKGANKDLNSRIDALSQKITDMQTQHAGEEEKLRAELKSAATAHEQVLREAVQMKEDELRTLQKTAADQKGILEERLKALQAETAQEKGANKDLNSRIDALSQKIADMQTQHAGEEEKLRAELKSAATAHEQVLREAVQMKEDELRTLQKTAADQKGILEEQLKALQAETAQEKGANKDLNSRIDALSQKITDMQTQHAGEEEKLRAELKSAATAHEQVLREAVQMKEDELRTLQKTAADQKGILEEQLKALQAETAQEKGANKDLNSRIDALSQKITDMQTQHAGEEEKLRAELKSAATAHEQVLREAVQMKEDELRTLQKTAADQKGILEEQLKALQAETAQEKGANKDLNSRIDALSQKITDMQTQHAGEEEKLRAELKSAATAHEQVLREAVQMKEDELRTLQKTAADQKGILEEQLKALQAETAQEKGANKDLNSRIDALSQKITDMRTQHAGEEEKLRAELKSAATAHEQVLREAVQMKEDELRTLQKTAADQKGILEERLKALQAETAQEKGANKDLNSRIDALSQKITDMQTQHAGEEEKLRAELKSAAMAHKQALQDAITHLRDVNKERHKAQDAVADANAANKRLVDVHVEERAAQETASAAELAKIQVELARLNAQLTALEAELKLNQTKLSAAEKEKGASAEESNNLAKIVEDQRDKLASLKSQEEQARKEVLSAIEQLKAEQKAALEEQRADWERKYAEANKGKKVYEDSFQEAKAAADFQSREVEQLRIDNANLLGQQRKLEEELSAKQQSFKEELMKQKNNNRRDANDQTVEDDELKEAAKKHPEPPAQAVKGKVSSTTQTDPEVPPRPASKLSSIKIYALRGNQSLNDYYPNVPLFKGADENVLITINFPEQQLTEDEVQQFVTKEGLNVKAPSSGHRYSFSYEDKIPKAVLTEEGARPTPEDGGDEIKYKNRLAATVINMIDNVLSRSTELKVDTQEPFIAEIARQYVSYLKDTTSLKIVDTISDCKNIPNQDVKSKAAADIFNQLKSKELEATKLKSAPWYRAAEEFRRNPVTQPAMAPKM